MFIISASAMRSGSSWYLNLTNDMLMEAGYPDVRDLRFEHELETTIQNQFADIGKPRYTKLLRLLWVSYSTGPFVVKTHSQPSRGIRLLSYTGQLKSTYIYRDPRDRLVSLMDMGQRVMQLGDTQSPFARFQSFEQALEHIKEARAHYEAWSYNPGTLVLRYEDLVRNTLGEMQRLNSYLKLGLPEAALKLIAGRYRPGRLPPDGQYTHYQKGQIGRYRETLTPQQIDQIHAAIGDDLVRLGYSLE